MTSKGNKISFCKICNLNKWDGTKSICCDGCNRWYHQKCTSISESEFLEL